MVKLEIRIKGNNIKVLNDSEYLIQVVGDITRLFLIPKGGVTSVFDVGNYDYTYVIVVGHDLELNGNVVSGDVKGISIQDRTKKYYLVGTETIYLKEVDEETFDNIEE
jgi:hypothetical protein